MLQEFHQKGGDINARGAYATPQPDVPILAPGRKCSEHCPRALPYLAEHKALGATPYPLTPFSLGATPTWLPHPFCLFCFLPPACLPHLCRVPLVHAAAAWHRGGSTPLMDAALEGATAAVASLVERRADLDAQNNRG